MSKYIQKKYVEGQLEEAKHYIKEDAVNTLSMYVSAIKKLYPREPPMRK